MIAFLVASVLTLPVSADLELESITALNYVWQDDFDSTVLDPAWSWVREDSDHWSLTDNPGYLQITTQTGGVGGWTNDQRNLLLTSAPSGDFQITTKVTINPTQNFQYAAIQVYQDDDNYVQLNRAYANGDTVNFDLEVDGSPTNIQVAVPDTTLYLRIRREGNSYMGYYSTNGSTYTYVGGHIANLDYAAVGLGAANNMDGLPEIPADFDFFKMESEFPVYDYSFIDDSSIKE
jgi:beta-xylosidase